LPPTRQTKRPPSSRGIKPATFPNKAIAACTAAGGGCLVVPAGIEQHYPLQAVVNNAVISDVTSKKSKYGLYLE
jgi:hypothetical protein